MKSLRFPTLCPLEGSLPSHQVFLGVGGDITEHLGDDLMEVFSIKPHKIFPSDQAVKPLEFRLKFVSISTRKLDSPPLPGRSSPAIGVIVD